MAGREVIDTRPPDYDAPAGTTGRVDGTRRAVLVSLVACSVGLGLVALLLMVVPWLGAIVAIAAFVLLVPLGSARASTRLVITVLLACGLLAVALGMGDQLRVRVLTPDRLRAALAVPALVAALTTVSSAARGRRPDVARLDLGVLTLLLVGGCGWVLTGVPALGVGLGPGVGGLMMLGWDHQSHFSIFSYLYEQRGVWRSGGPADASMFLGYPPLAGAVGVALAMLVAPADLAPAQQLAAYLQTTAATFGVGAALLAWTGGSIAGRLAGSTSHRRHEGGIALVSGVVVGGYVVLGPAAAFFDYGFTNFLFAVAVAAAASWLCVAELRLSPAVAAAVAVAAATALAQLWTPLVVLMLPAGLAVLVASVRGRHWRSLALMTCLALVGGWCAAWQAFRIAPTGVQASSLAQVLAGASGGQPAVPLPHLVALAVLGVGVPLMAGQRRALVSWWPVVAPTTGLLIVLVFVVNTAQAGFRVSGSYYVAKSWWIVYLAAIPVAGAAVAVAALGLLSRRAHGDGPWRSRFRVAIAGLVSAVLLWGATPTQNAPNGSIDYYSTPVGAEAVRGRWNALRDGPQGKVVAYALEASAAWPDRLAIAWDNGDLLTNRWLASLRSDLDSEANAVYSVLGPPPFGEPARDALTTALEDQPTLEVVLVVVTPESHDLLQPLTRRFRGRVIIRHG